MNKINTEKDNLKVGIFTDSYYPYISGVVRSIELLKKELESRGHGTFIFAPNYPTAWQFQEKNVFRFFSIPAPTQKNFFLPVPFSPRLPFLVQNLKLDVIHVHSPFLLGSLGAATAKRFKLPLIFTFHTLYHFYVHYTPFGRNISAAIIKKWNKKFCNRCDLIIAPSLFVKKLITEYGVSKPVDVIPTGIDDSYYLINNDNKEWIKKHFHLDEKDKILLHVGRLSKEKNIDYLIEAMGEIQKTISHVKLIIVGTGPEETNLRRLAHQKNLESSVFFSGQINHSELLKCYAGADIFTFASRSETQGLVVGEAKAAGLPVVCSFSPCLSETIFHGKDGFLVHTLQDFVEKIKYLLENEPLRKNMGKRAKINALRYSSNLLANKMLQRYQKAIQDKN
ncbi:MAG TPA: glycosyltransferase family 4 protein [Firmicutes bacterium]|nr:glycosyltransferase family 4 protein [Bacillota bacterium]